MTECNAHLPLNFPTARRLEVQFSELQLSSDGGLLLVRQLDEQLQLSTQMAACLHDPRDPNRVTHSMVQLVCQRLYQIVAGYEDVNDSTPLRQDPILKLICERLPGAETQHLASQPTLCRLENRAKVAEAVKRQELAAMRRYLLQGFISRFQAAPQRLILDLDGWDDPTYGEQQLSFFHGYFDQKMYFPVLLNEAESGYPLVLQLRSGNSHAGKGVEALLRWVFWRLRQAWPEVQLCLRADAGFALPELVRLCERSRVEYVFGMPSNAVIKRKSAALVEQARLQFCQSGEKARLFDDVYYAAQSWPQPRRLIIKAEWGAKGANPRYLITNLKEPAQAVYDQSYVQRGAASEQRIKELKRGLKADRLSCHEYEANQFRLMLMQAAYVLCLSLRHVAHGTDLATAQVERLRSSLLKVAARVRVSARRILVELTAHSPYVEELKLIATRLQSNQCLMFE